MVQYQHGLQSQIRVSDIYSIAVIWSHATTIGVYCTKSLPQSTTLIKTSLYTVAMIAEMYKN